MEEPEKEENNIQIDVFVEQNYDFQDVISGYFDYI